MLDESTRNAVLKLHEQGHGKRAIATALNISRASVRKVLRAGKAAVPVMQRAERAAAFEADIRELYLKCKGNLVRVHEELPKVIHTDNERPRPLSYQALTAFCRRHGIGHEPKRPSGQYHFGPGEEMQHDTSPHRVKLGGVERLAQTASLVFCFSRRLFFQLYPTFNRFICKVFITDALKYFGGAAGRCVIDNTHVVVLRGTGREMVPVPEMEAFSKRLGFEWMAHEKGDANRSARVERPFDYIENNFLAGREFDDFAHLNREAIVWCDKVNATFKRSLQAVPRELFQVEAPRLKPLPAWVPEVYTLHHRIVDLEGYVHLGGHIYSVPWQLIGRQLEVRETKDKVHVYQGPRQVAEHERVFSFEKRRVTLSEHRPPKGQVHAVEQQGSPDERELQQAEAPVAAYAAALKKRGSGRWPAVLRRLAQMRRDYPTGPLLKAINEAAHYGLYDVDRLERMVLRNIATEYFVVPLTKPPRNQDGDGDEG